MNKLAYIACSYQNRTDYLPLVESIKNSLIKHNWSASVPVFDLSHLPGNQYRQIMDESFDQLSKASLLIAEGSEKNIGVGIEVGYAKALNIPIIYLYKVGAEFSTTVAGSANEIIEYTSELDVAKEIERIIVNISLKI
jgi:2'-deoxynucleoside 5'-phosphate N-hydrolase